MKWRFLLSVASLGGLLSPAIQAQSSPSNNPCVGETFYHARMEKQEIFREFEGGVFRIWTTRQGDTDPLTVGTAFLIDTQRGYVLTAFHVVEPALIDVRGSIQGTSSRLPSQLLRFKFIKHLPAPNDVAILQVIDPSSLIGANVRALDIAFHFKPMGSPYFTIGYPRGKRTPNVQEAELQGRDDNGHSLDVKQDVDEGTSGSPLIDEDGAALGVATDMLNRSEALYTAMADLEDLFENLSYESVIKDLDSKVLGESVATIRLELIQQLRWTWRSPTNVELYEWARHIYGNRSQYKSSRFYFDCPILQAYIDRRLTDSPFVQQLASLFSSETLATMLLDSADQNLLLGRAAVAEKLARQSLNIYSEFNNQPGRAAALMLIGRANLESSAYIEASNYFQNAVTIEPNTLNKAQIDLYLGEAYVGQADWQRAALKLQSALDQFKAVGDRRSEGAVYIAFGKLASHRGDFPQAVSYLQRSSTLCEAVRDQICVSSAKRELARLELASPLVANRQVASHEPLEHEGFWGHLNPFARKKYVQQETQDIRSRINELDELTTANSKMIKDVDARAQQGIQLASSKANEADQHAIDAGNRAIAAQQTAQQAATRLQTVETVVGNIDNYEPSADMEIGFRTRQTVLSKKAKEALDEMATPLKNQRGYIIEVQAFSPGRGQAAIAKAQEMAESVVRYLVLNHDIPINRIYMIGMSNAPIGNLMDKSAKTKPVNRSRVEIKLLRAPQRPQRKDANEP